VSRQTKLGLFCEGIIEAGWLAAVIVTPLFFNFYSYRVFEADKVSLLRSIALAMVLAWVIKLLEGGSRRSRQESASSFVRTPLVIPTLIFAALYILTTVTSVVPQLSFWGSYNRRQGTYIALSYMAIFLLMLETLRRRQQLERLIAVVLLTSLPVALYGIIQHYNLEPLVWIGGSGAARVESTLGNPIFVAAYLIMVVPLTVGRLVGALPGAEKKTVSSFVRAGCYFLLLALQLLCIYFTQSRGPVIGLMGGLFFFFLLLAVSKGRKGLALTVIGLSTGLILLPLVLNLPNSPLAFIKQTPYLGRFGRIFETGSGSGRQRVLIWEGDVALISADPVRALIGHGPETICVAFNPYFSAELADMCGPHLTVDRSHNETFDLLVTMGLAGLSAYLLLVGSVFYHGLKGLGLIGSSKQRTAFVLLESVGGGLGVLMPRLLEGTWRFVGVGLPLGLVAGMAVYLILYILFLEQTGGCSRRDQNSALDLGLETGGHRLLAISLLSAVIAHFIEIQIGIALAATYTYFWVYAALLVILCCSLQEEASARVVAGALPAAASGNRRGRRRKRRAMNLPSPGDLPGWWRRPALSYSLLTGLVLITMGFGFIIYGLDLRDKGPVVLGFIATVWLLSGAAVWAETGRGRASAQHCSGEGFSFPLHYLVSLSCFLVYMALQAVMLRPGVDIGNVVILYYLFLFLAMAAIAAFLTGGKAIALPPRRRAVRWLYPLLGAGIAGLILTTNLNITRADVYYRLAEKDAKQTDEKIALYRRALALAPNRASYHLSLGLASLAEAGTATDTDRRSAWFEESRRALERAMEINPLEPDRLASLGLLYQAWSRATADPMERAMRLEKALDYYRRATALSPNYYRRHLEDDVAMTYALLGNAYLGMRELDKAATACQKALELNPSSPQTHRNLGYVFALQGKLEEAAWEILAAVEIDPSDWADHKNLAILYQQLGRMQEALTEAKAARELAPAEERAELDTLIAQLEMQKP